MVQKHSQSCLQLIKTVISVVYQCQCTLSVYISAGGLDRINTNKAHACPFSSQSLQSVDTVYQQICVHLLLLTGFHVMFQLDRVDLSGTAISCSCIINTITLPRWLIVLTRCLFSSTTRCGSLIQQNDVQLYYQHVL